jgi:hypothetical protein
VTTKASPGQRVVGRVQRPDAQPVAGIATGRIVVADRGLRIAESRARLALAAGGNTPDPGAVASAMAVGLSEHAPTASLWTASLDFQMGFARCGRSISEEVRARRTGRDGTLLRIDRAHDDALVSPPRRWREPTPPSDLRGAARAAKATPRFRKRPNRTVAFQEWRHIELDVAQSATLLESTRATIPRSRPIAAGPERAEHLAGMLAGSVQLR